MVGDVDAGLAARVSGLTVREVWRYPVKSLQGERLDRATLGPEGIAGDRGWALFDLDTGFGLTARRVPDLLFASARTRGDGSVEVVLPDGTVAAGDDGLSAWTGRRIALRSVGEVTGARRGEFPSDPEADRGWNPFEGAPGAFHDDPDTRVSLLSTGTIGRWHPHRFRANLLLDGAGEDALVGRRVRVGDAELAVVAQVPRCVMVTRPQPGGIGRETSVLKTLHRERDGVLAVGALVTRPGTVAVGDALTVLDRPVLD